MRLRRKPWVDAAIHEFDDFVFSRGDERLLDLKGNWRREFPADAPLYAEFGTGKGDFICAMAEKNPAVNFVGVELQQDVLYSAAKKAAARELKNLRLAVFDINKAEELFAEKEIDRLYINFCDPWPKLRHAKRRLTHRNFLTIYQKILAPHGKLLFKTDNEGLFRFSLAEFAAQNLSAEKITFDLHADNDTDNIMTEYEKKFSEKGQKICRAEVTFP